MFWTIDIPHSKIFLQASYKYYSKIKHILISNNHDPCYLVPTAVSLSRLNTLSAQSPLKQNPSNPQPKFKSKFMVLSIIIPFILSILQQVDLGFIGYIYARIYIYILVTMNFCDLGIDLDEDPRNMD